MVRFLFTFLFVGILQQIMAQMHDVHWLFGYNYKHNHFLRANFADGSQKIDTVTLNGFFDYWHNNAAYSNQDGSSSLFFNGLSIRNSQYQTIEGGENFKIEIEKYKYSLSDDRLTFGAVFLPYPNHRDSCILLYSSRKVFLKPNGNLLYITSVDLSCAVIDMKANAGQGKVVSNHLSIIKDTIQGGGLSAVQHANGRDWWVLVQEFEKNEYYTLLIDPDGVHIMPKQKVRHPTYQGLVKSVFSPDGKTYVTMTGNIINKPDGCALNIFDFDRCTGLLSNQRQYYLYGQFATVAISPNSRYLYQSQVDSMFQYDLHSPDIWASRTLIGLYDGFQDPFPSTFWSFQLAPDGKIYGTSTNGVKNLHVIHRPDEGGNACQFAPHGIPLPIYNQFSIPNLPNYRLGPIDGSPCDTLGINNLPRAWYRHEQDSLEPLRVDFHDLSFYEPHQWRWDFGDPASGSWNSSTERHPEHVFSSAGKYEVCLTVKNPLGEHTFCRMLFLGITGVEDIDNQLGLQVWPNPSTGLLQITLPDPPETQSVQVQFTDLTGRIVWSNRIMADDNTLSVDARVLPDGVYFCKVRAAQREYLPVKMVINR